MSTGKAETQLSMVMERLRARSLHQASWMETVKVLNTSLSAVSAALCSHCPIVLKFAEYLLGMLNSVFFVTEVRLFKTEY